MVLNSEKVIVLSWVHIAVLLKVMDNAVNSASCLNGSFISFSLCHLRVVSGKILRCLCTFHKLEGPTKTLYIHECQQAALVRHPDDQKERLGLNITQKW